MESMLINSVLNSRRFAGHLIHDYPLISGAVNNGGLCVCVSGGGFYYKETVMLVCFGEENHHQLVSSVGVTKNFESKQFS